MLKLFRSIQNFQVDSNNLDWDNRNIRIMNVMAFLLGLSMLLFLCFSLVFKAHANLVYLSGAVIMSGVYFLVLPMAPLKVTKFYFCILPASLAIVFSIFIVGEPGNDKYYTLICSLLPLVVFKNKWIIFPIMWYNMAGFYLIEWAQANTTPATVLPAGDLEIYRTLNVLMFFTFLYSVFQLFKTESEGYQKEVELQKEIIEEKNHEVQQSIEYAKKIQEAILPPDSFKEKHLPNSFVLYKPKDIVAGDFYWMEVIDDIVLFAAADCTGHGVPGAMVSVVCHNALTRSVLEFNLTDPAKILDKTRELVIETFVRSDREVKDGMDIGICAYHKKDKKLLFAGANNGLYFLRNDELEEIKPDKQPIGNYEDAKPFSTHEVAIENDDLIYLFTDGFADQFGGDKGKKFKYKPFKQLLKTLASKDIHEHGNQIDAAFENWKGDLEQVDDVCIIGVRF